MHYVTLNLHMCCHDINWQCHFFFWLKTFVNCSCLILAMSNVEREMRRLKHSYDHRLINMSQLHNWVIWFSITNLPWLVSGIYKSSYIFSFNTTVESMVSHSQLSFSLWWFWEIICLLIIWKCWTQSVPET